MKRQNSACFKWTYGLSEDNLRCNAPKFTLLLKETPDSYNMSKSSKGANSYRRTDGPTVIIEKLCLKKIKL